MERKSVIENVNVMESLIEEVDVNSINSINEVKYAYESIKDIDVLDVSPGEIYLFIYLLCLFNISGMI